MFKYIHAIIWVLERVRQQFEIFPSSQVLYAYVPSEIGLVELTLGAKSNELLLVKRG